MGILFCMARMRAWDQDVLCCLVPFFDIRPKNVVLGGGEFVFVYLCWLSCSLVSFSANPLTIQRSAVSSLTVYILPARSTPPLHIFRTFIFTVIFFSIAIRTPFGMISVLYTRFWGGGKGERALGYMRLVSHVKKRCEER